MKEEGDLQASQQSQTTKVKNHEHGVFTKIRLTVIPMFHDRHVKITVT